MNATTTRPALAKQLGKVPDTTDGFVGNDKVSAEGIQGSKDKFESAEYVGSCRHPTSFLYAFDDIIRDANIPQFLCEHKASLRFPETLLLMLVQAERDAAKVNRHPEDSCIAWASNGRAIIIRNKELLTNKLLPEFFCKSKFSSFTRKLYRWGFRQVTGKANSKKKSRADQMVFSHPLFQRDDKPLMMNMKSVTAEGTKRELACQKLTNQQEAKLSTQMASQRTSRVAVHPLAEICRDQEATYPHYLERQTIRSCESDRFASLVSQKVSLHPISQAQVLVTQGRTIADLAYYLNLSSDPMLMHSMGTRGDELAEAASLQALLHSSRGLKPETTIWPISHQVAYINSALPLNYWHLG